MMLRAKIKDVVSPDIENLATYQPDDPEVFSYLLEILVGPEQDDGMELFQIVVCTPQWLLKTHNKDDIVMGRHLLIVFEHDFTKIMNWMNSYVNRCTGETWHEVAEKVGRLGEWEFESKVV